MDNHYTPGSIRWTRKQCIFLLQWSSLLKEGKWPSDYKETGYAGSKSRPNNQRAPYETAIQIWAELAVRIGKTGQDGYFLVQVYSSENQLAEMDRIARAFQIDINEVSERLERALKYVTGWCRRWQKCSSCRVKDCPKRGKKQAYEYQSWRY